MTTSPGLAVPSLGFDPVGRGWIVLGCKTAAEIPVTNSLGDVADPWIIAGETSDAPTGLNDVTAQDTTDPPDGILDTPGSTYAMAGALQPGHAWPFQTLDAQTRSVDQLAASTISAGGYYPSAGSTEAINSYRRFVRLAPRMFGSSGRVFLLRASGLLKATNAANVLDLVFQHDLVTSVDAGGANTTAFDANKRWGFRHALGNLGANEVPFELEIVGHAMGPKRSVWRSSLVVAAQTNPETTSPALDQRRGPLSVNLTAGPDMDTTGSLLAFLFAARRSTAIGLFDIGTAGGAAQDGSEVYVKIGAAIALLSPGQ